jgi:hydroxymethylpyrimidine/phosphomethylpyrimidine kinase
MKPLCLSIGGLDPTGGAGILLDINVFRDLDVRGFAVPGVLTAQCTDKVYGSLSVKPDFFKTQLIKVLSSYKIKAIKIGLIHPELVPVLVELKEFLDIPHRVLDPILFSSSGFKFISPTEILPLARISTLMTPNLEEARALLNSDLGHNEDLAIKLKSHIGCDAILLKGGHENSATDILVEKDNTVSLVLSEIARSSNDVHGTGCLLSAAVVSNLAKGTSLAESIKLSKDYLSKKLDSAEKLGDDERYSFLF